MKKPIPSTDEVSPCSGTRGPHSSNRRNFLRISASAGAAMAFPAIVPSTVFGRNAPSNRINMGLIGMGLMMEGHRKTMTARGDVQVLAVCDVDRGKRDQAKAEVEKVYATRTTSGTFKGCDAYNEYERIVERADIDAVMVVTPDHWHAPISIAAMRGGKDVYVQKPMTLTVVEGRMMADVARRYGAVLQVGSQQRSDSAFRKACEIVRNGWIGKISTIYASLGSFPPPELPAAQPIPDGFDYDRWLGPTPWFDYNAERVKGDYGGGWRRFYEYGSRKNGDWGAHHFDIIQWALGMDNSGPVKFLPKGFKASRYQTHIYANGIQVLRDHATKNGAMIQFNGSDGEVMVSRGNKLETTPSSLRSETLGARDVHLYESPEHHENWLSCIRTRQATVCPPEIGHRTATICHLSGIAEQLGRPISWNPIKEVIVGDSAAVRWLDRPRRAPYVTI